MIEQTVARVVYQGDGRTTEFPFAFPVLHRKMCIRDSRKEIKSGDTLWNICSEIATDREDLRKLVWQAMQDNHIEDPAELQPGRVVIVRVKAAREQ